MAKTQLTDRQQEVYELIRSLITQRGYGPTVREIGQNFGIKSPNGVMCHLRALERKGLITRQANKSRAIELTTPAARSVSGLPMLGVISGQPLPMSGHTTDRVDLGDLLFDQSRFVVQVSGSEFLDNGIRDGDFLVLSRAADPAPGQLVLMPAADETAKLMRWPNERPGHHRNGRVGEPTPLGVVVSLVRLQLA